MQFLEKNGWPLFVYSSSPAVARDNGSYWVVSHFLSLLFKPNAYKSNWSQQHSLIHVLGANCAGKAFLVNLFLRIANACVASCSKAQSLDSYCYSPSGFTQRTELIRADYKSAEVCSVLGVVSDQYAKYSLNLMYRRTLLSLCVAHIHEV